LVEPVDAWFGVSDNRSIVVGVVTEDPADDGAGSARGMS
jgi:hypothetical protein